MKTHPLTNSLNHNSEFLASYYRQLIDAEFDRARLNRAAVLCCLSGLAVSALGHWFDFELIRTLGAIPLIIALVCAACSLVQSLIIRRLRHELDGPTRAVACSRIPSGCEPSMPNGKCSMLDAQ